MEARPATADAPRSGQVRRRPASPGAEDPFRLGYRWRYVTAPDGREALEQIPLTAEDLVYPKEDDQVSQGLPHAFFVLPQADAIIRHLEDRPVLVTWDVLLVLRHDGKTCSPDVGVIEGGVDTSKITGAVNLAAVGGRLTFVLEAVSTSEKEIEDKDLKTNVVRYAEEGVEEYFTVYPLAEGKARDLVGRRLEKDGYVSIAPDAQGRVYSEKLGLFFHVDAASEELVIVDARTGQRLLTSSEEAARRKQAEERVEREAEARRQAEVRAEQAEAHGLRRGVEDLCAVLGLAWDAGRRARVERMSPSQLETLRRHLVHEKSWPEEPL